MAKIYNEFWGVRDPKIAKISFDEDGNETFGDVQDLAGLQTLTAQVTENSEAHYYDNKSAIVLSSEGDDTYELTVSVVDRKTRALIEGLTYDEDNDALIGTAKNKPYFALGFVASLDDGTEILQWIYKGKFSVGTITHNTRTDGVDTSNMSYTFTSVHTAKKFQINGDGDTDTAKYLQVPADKVAEEDFFSKVYTPDKLFETKED